MNRTLAAAALLGSGVLTDVVANTAAGHTRKLVVETPRRAAVRHRIATTTHSHAGTTSGEHASSHSVQSTSSASQSSSSSSIAPAASSAPTVVAVSGGS